MEHQYPAFLWIASTTILCIAIVVAVVYARRSARKMGVHSKDTVKHTASGPVVSTEVSTPATRGEGPIKKP